MLELPTSVTPQNFDSKLQGVYSLLNQKGNQKIREMFRYLEAELKNISSLDSVLVLYSKIKDMLENLQLTESEYKGLMEVLNYLLKNIAKNYSPESKLMQAMGSEVRDERHKFEDMVFNRDIVSPCVAYLKQKIPGISPHILADQVKLSYLKMAWAYADISEQDNALQAQKIDEIHQNREDHLADVQLLKDFIESNPAAPDEEALMNKIIQTQKKRYKDKGNDKYLLNNIDKYTLHATREYDLDISAYGMLKLLDGAYNHKEYTGYSTKQLAPIIDKMEKKVADHNANIQKLLDNSKCKDYQVYLAECKKLNQNYSNTTILTQITQLSEQVDKITKLTGDDLAMLDVNDRKKVEAYKNQKAEKRQQEKAFKQLSDQMTICSQKPFQLKGDIVYVYVDINTKIYLKYMQPNTRVYVNFDPQRPKANTLQIRDSQGRIQGWVKRSNVNFSEYPECNK